MPLARIAMLLVAAFTGAAQTYTLTVNQGSGSGSYAPNSQVHIWADPPTATTVFAGWAGETQYLLEPGSPHTLVSMPALAVNLRASYRTVPAFTVQSAVFATIPVVYYLPPNPAGLVFVFHGAGGAAQLVTSSPEYVFFLRDAVAAGFGVIAFDSQDTTDRQWNIAATGAANPDVTRVQNVLQALRDQRFFAPDLPVFAVGHSNGGHFAHLAAPAIRFAAIAITDIPGSAFGLSNFNGPVFWQISANDDYPGVGAQGNAAAVADFETLANRRIPARLSVWEAQPLYAERFARIPGISLADSQEIFRGFQSSGFLDANNYLRRNPSQLNWRPQLPARFSALADAVDRQLQVTYAAHEFSSDGNQAILDVFLSAIGRRPALSIISGASFSGTGVARASIAAVFPPGLAPVLTVPSAPASQAAGAAIVIRDSANREFPGLWFFVSPSQGSFLVPSGVALGQAVAKIQSASRRWAVPLTVTGLAPGIFTANGDGRGVPAAIALRVPSQGDRSSEFVFRLDQQTGRYIPAPIRFGPGDRLFLDIYGTGIRQAGTSGTQVLLNSTAVAPLYADAQPQYPGLDQVTFEVLPSFANAGPVTVVVVAGGVRSNMVELVFRN